MGILAWLLFGLIAGVVAQFIDPTPNRGGIIGSIVLGIVGAIVGGFLASIVLGVQGITGFNFQSLVVAVLGSLLLLFVGRSLQRSLN